MSASCGTVSVGELGGVATCRLGVAHAPDVRELSTGVTPSSFLPVCRVEYAPDTKVANAGTFTMQREDHTVGNLVRMCVRAGEGTTKQLCVHCVARACVRQRVD